MVLWMLTHRILCQCVFTSISDSPNIWSILELGHTLFNACMREWVDPVEVLVTCLAEACTRKLGYNKHFGIQKTDTIRSFYGRIRYIEVRLTGPDGIRSEKNVGYTERFVSSRFIVSKFTCIYISAEKAAYALDMMQWFRTWRWPGATPPLRTQPRRLRTIWTWSVLKDHLWVSPQCSVAW